ncbi:MAG: phosphopentomutase [Clostridia bacterium]|nr:phosphopentomutase [Clostridia bacterium]
MAKRVFLVVLDSFGIGAAPDAADFGDVGTNTLKRISQSAQFRADTFSKLGLFNIDGVDYGVPQMYPLAAHARMQERSRGKDTTIGHWEIAGLISETPLPTYPDGFPADVIDAFTKATGRGVLCNKPYSGTAVIADYGERHVKTGELIVYTSADSVFQIAAHEDVVPIETLYDYCRKAREILKGKHGVGRVIARPFTGTAPNFTRTSRRRDFSLVPPKDTVLDAIKNAGKDVIAVGKIEDIFAQKGVTRAIHTANNAEGMQVALDIQKQDFTGLCFINLVDFDMLYGHRQDVDGYAAAIAAVDAWLPSFLGEMREDDLLMITADHGCDPGDDSTDHTREYTPFLMIGGGVYPRNYGTRDTFADIAATIATALDVPFTCAGVSMLGDAE